MLRIKKSILINSSKENVWNIISNISNKKLWSLNIIDSNLLSESLDIGTEIEHNTIFKYKFKDKILLKLEGNKIIMESFNPILRLKTINSWSVISSQEKCLVVYVSTVIGKFNFLKSRKLKKKLDATSNNKLAQLKYFIENNKKCSNKSLLEFKGIHKIKNRID